MSFQIYDAQLMILVEICKLLFVANYNRDKLMLTIDLFSSKESHHFDDLAVNSYHILTFTKQCSNKKSNIIIG